MRQAETIARQVVDQSGYKGLFVAHIMEFDNNFYVAAKDKSSGEGAFEFLIDRYTGFVHPEPQSMMWNTRYGHIGGRGYPGGYYGGYYGGMMSGAYGGMMGGYYGPTSTASRSGTLSIAQAKEQAQKFLDAQIPGTKAGESIKFPGYYTIDVTRDGKPIGMLSVNAYSGQVWYHSWHGTFITEEDLH